uniref:Uncharacterized protein LOC111135266 isoform X1 n=2 Tax=Crassostrea virginica TaxID=6565 RepID=A0A8B8ELV4_CRAVI|nr:uncharacterized protein LOC111135266 isoform X1 [Crassostrea virginica]
MYLPGSNITLHIHCKHTKTLNSKEYVVLSKRKSEMALKELEFVIFFSVLLDMVHAYYAFDNQYTMSVWILLVIGVVGSMVVLVGLVFAVYWCCSKLSATPNTSPLIDPDQQMYTTTESRDLSEQYLGQCNEAMENDISEQSFGYSVPPPQSFPTADSYYGYSTQPTQPYVYLPSDVR